VAGRGKPCAKPPQRPQRSSPRAPGRVDSVAVWVTYQLVGGVRAAERHDLARRTLYRVVAEVEADPAKLAAAQAQLLAQREAVAKRQAEVEDAARELLLARIRAGTLHPRHLVALVTAGGRPSPGGAPRAAMELPSFLTTPRTET
jgi:hypothetical protein